MHRKMPNIRQLLRATGSLIMVGCDRAIWMDDNLYFTDEEQPEELEERVSAGVEHIDEI